MFSNLRRIAERAIEKQKDVYVCFIDYSKAFDKVNDTLFRTLDALDVDEADKRVLADLYWRQSVAVKHNNEISEWQEIKRGVRQGCVGSPHLFNLYTEPIMRQLDDQDGFPLGGRHLNNLRYADNTVILAGSQRKLQELMNIDTQESEAMGLTIYTGKSVTMTFSKSEQPPQCLITIGGEQVKQVESFSYLGSLLTSDGRSDKEIKKR